MEGEQVVPPALELQTEIALGAVAGVRRDARAPTRDRVADRCSSYSHHTLELQPEIAFELQAFYLLLPLALGAYLPFQLHGQLPHD